MLRPCGKTALGAFWIAILLAMIAPLTAAADEYRLGPQDRVRLKVYEWRPSSGDVIQFAALNDEFTVGADGTLSLPFVGALEVRAMRPEGVAAAIAERLTTRMGLPAPPDVAVEVTRYRPFYILGNVAAPGEYEYRPGLTVVQAVSLAGGYPVAGGTDRPSGLRELISERGQIGLLELEEIDLLAKGARLTAEQSQSERVELPAEFADRTDTTGPLAAVMEQERMIFEARRRADATQIETLSNLKDFLRSETQALEGQIAILDRQLASIETEMASLDQIVQQSLATNARRTSLERALLQTQGDRLTAETALLRARQELSRADLSILERSSDRAQDISADLRETEAALEAVRQKKESALMMLAASDAALAAELADAESETTLAPSFTILRPQDGALVALDASDATAILPGDTLEVELRLPGAATPAAPGGDIGR